MQNLTSATSAIRFFQFFFFFLFPNNKCFFIAIFSFFSVRWTTSALFVRWRLLASYDRDYWRLIDERSFRNYAKRVALWWTDVSLGYLMGKLLP